MFLLSAAEKILANTRAVWGLLICVNTPARKTFEALTEQLSCRRLFFQEDRDTYTYRPNSVKLGWSSGLRPCDQ